MELSNVFDVSHQLAPEIVIKLTQEIERQASLDPYQSIDLYKLYRTKVPLDELNHLREQVNTSNITIDLGYFKIQFLVSLSINLHLSANN